MSAWLQEPHIAKLQSLATLTPSEQNLLRQLPRAQLRTRSDLTPHCANEHPSFLVGGWAAWCRHLKSSRRQIIQILVPGDAIRLPVEVAVPGEFVIALTNVTLASSSRLASTSPDLQRGIQSALQRTAVERVALLHNHVMRLGRQDAFERLANFMLEIEHRGSAAGWIEDDGSVDMPLTQEMIGDLLGLSVVHINRTLQSMRASGAIDLTGRKLRLLDRTTLADAAEFRLPTQQRAHVEVQST